MTSDGAIERLTAILEAIAAAADNPAKLEALLDAVVGVDAVFSSAALLKGGYAGRSFVIASSRNMGDRWARGWMRWPLRRLFVRMRPARIADPSIASSAALAIPFSYGSERCVVVAPLAESASVEHDAFLSALESVTVPATVEASRLVAPLSSYEPVVAAFGVCESLHRAIASALLRRGWPVEFAKNFPALARMFRESHLDIVAVDMPALEDPLSAITTIHRTADYGALRVLAFGHEQRPPAHSVALIDRYLPHGASEHAIFKTVKDLAHNSARIRQNAMPEDRAITKRRATVAANAGELADFASRRAAAVMSGWACCFLINESGTIYRSEYPPNRGPVFTAVPNAFLTGDQRFQVGFDRTFLEELTDSDVEREAFAAMRPVSAAALGLVSPGGFHRGVLVACSLERTAGAQAFRALDVLADSVVERFGELERETIPELRRDRLWQHFRDRKIELDVYRSGDCTIPWRYRALDDAAQCFLHERVRQIRAHLTIRAPVEKFDGRMLAEELDEHFTHSISL